MSPAAANSAALPPQRGGGNASRGSRLRRFLAIDERADCIAWSQAVSGRSIIYCTAIAAVATYFPWWETLLVVSAAMAAAYMSNFRNPILFTATWSAAFLEMGLAENSILEDIGVVMQQEQMAGPPPMVLASLFLLFVMIGAWGSLEWVRRHPHCLLARRPLLCLLALEVVLCGLTTMDSMQGLPRVMLWSMLIVLTPYVWFLPFAIVDQRSQQRVRASERAKRHLMHREGVGKPSFNESAFIDINELPPSSQRR